MQKIYLTRVIRISYIFLKNIKKCECILIQNRLDQNLRMGQRQKNEAQCFAIPKKISCKGNHQQRQKQNILLVISFCFINIVAFLILLLPIFVIGPCFF